MFYVGRGTVRTKLYGPEKDSYLGSGIYLKRAISKYGKDAFYKEILEYCDTIDAAKDRERYWIKTLDALNPNIAYNLTPDSAGFTSETSSKVLAAWYVSLTEEQRIQLYQKRAEGIRKSRDKFRKRTKEMWAKLTTEEREELKKRMSEGWTEELREKQRQRMQGSQRKSVHEYMVLKYGEEQAEIKYSEYLSHQKTGSRAAQSRRIASFKETYSQCPYYAEKNKLVNQRRSVLSKLRKQGKITEEDYVKEYEKTTLDNTRLRQLIDNWRNNV